MHLFSLEKSSKKHICPRCGKKRFVRYVNTLTKEYLHSTVGRCDREINCGYHYKPKDYFRDNKEIEIKPEYKNYIFQKPENKVDKSVSYIDNSIFRSSLKNYSQNNFVQYLHTLFPDYIVQALCERFYIGTSKHWQGATVFWQVDEKKKVRSGKIILYNKNTGKRSKHITWVHSVLKISDFNLKQCLFGLHQLPEYQDKIIGIVESEKTAVIMTGLGLSEGILDNYIWLATGSLSMLKPDMLQILRNRKIVLYPDLGIDKNGLGTPYQRWNEKLPELQDITPYVAVSNLLEKKASSEQKEKGYDIADFVIAELQQKSKNLNYLIAKNPALRKLIQKLDLQVER